MQNSLEVRGIVPIARAINLGAVWARTQRQLGGFPMVTQDYVEKHLLLALTDPVKTSQSFCTNIHPIATCRNLLPCLVRLAGYLETPSGEPLLHIEEPWMQTGSVMTLSLIHI